MPGDNAASLVGYLSFAHDQWRWPLFHTALLNPSEGGANIIFTDPVPLMALLGKITFQLTGFLPLYIGPWILACYAFQSLVSYMIFRQIGLLWTHALAASALLVLLPSFIFRVGHVGLMAQFVVLLGILFYLRAVSVSDRLEFGVASSGVGAILFFHPYLLAMTAPVYIAGLAEAAHRGRLRWPEAVGYVVLIFAVASACALVFGIIGKEPLPKTGGFGFYSLNLLSPLTPQFSAFPIYRQSFLDKTGGQYEGFNYLGVGVLLLLLYAVVVRFREVAGLLGRHRFLAAAMVGLTLFAASDRIWIGPLYLGNLNYDRWPILGALTSTFRSSGRFFWPVSFILVITAVTLLARSRKNALALIVGTTLLQVADIFPILARSHDNTQVEAADKSVDWEAILAQHKELVVYPKYHCAARSDHATILRLQLQAARIGIPTNGAYLNRGDSACGQSARLYSDRIDAEAVTADPLVVLFKRSYPPVLLEGDPALDFFCRDAVDVFVCSKRNDAALVSVGTELKPTEPIPLDTRLTPVENGTGIPFMTAGWSAIEPNARWGEGPTTMWMARLPYAVCNELTFQAELVPLSMGDYLVRRTQVILNGKIVGEINLVATGPQTVFFHTPLGGECIETLRFELRFDEFRSPRSLGMNEDPRPLTWRYTWFAFGAD